MRHGIVVILLLSLVVPARGQSGPVLTQSVVAGGGGVSAQGPTRVEGTVGQPAAGESAGGIFSLSGGFQPVVAALAQPLLNVSDVVRAEGNAGAATFSFSVTLDFPAPAGGVTFNASTADGAADPANANGDYIGFTNQAGLIPEGVLSTTVAVQINGDGTQEANETFTLSVTNVVGATVSDGQGQGTILNDDGAPAPGQIVISEFRLRGPGADAQAEANNEFIEIYNKSDSDFVVVDSSPLTGLATDGWALVSSDNPTTPRYVIPAGTRIPARGHFLVANLLGYGLSLHPAGDDGSEATTATPDGTYSGDIADGAGLALFRTRNPLLLTSPAERLDSVGFTGVPPLFFEGSPLAPAGGVTASAEHSLLRRLNFGTTLDTGDNAADFALVATDPAAVSGATLGAPGPENLSGPVERNAKFKASLLDPMQPHSAAPNRARDNTPHACNGGAAPSNCSSGTLTIRRRFHNSTGAPVTRLRFRVVDITTRAGNAPPPAGTAELRVLSSAAENVSTTGGETVQVRATTLEGPPTQDLGGGLNSTLAAGTVTLSTPLAAGGSLNVQFLLGVEQAGTFRFFINVEALPGSAQASRARAGKLTDRPPDKQ